MQITAKNLPLNQIQATELPGLNGAPAKKGFSIGGFWLNGSEALNEDKTSKYNTPQELQKGLIGKELAPSKSGKSLIIVGSIAPRDTDFIATILTARVELQMADLNELI